MRTKSEDKREQAVVTELKVREWAGEKRYLEAKQMLHNVSEVRQVGKGGYLGSVIGGGDHVTLVELGEGGVFTSECTCEAGCDCEHAVALALVVAESLQGKKRIAPLEKEDARLLRLDDASASEGVPTNATEKKVFPWLESLDARKRLLLLIRLAKRYPSVLSDLKQEAMMVECTDRELIAQTKESIKKIGVDCNWCKHQRDPKPNYEPTRECVKRLVERELFAALLKVGVLFYEESEKLCYRQVRRDPETRENISSILLTIVKAVEQSKLPEEDKLFLDFRLHDGDKNEYSLYRYNFLEGNPSLWKTPEKCSQRAWSKVADTIATELLKNKDECLYSEENLYEAYANAGRNEAILDFMIQTIDRSGKYDNVSKKLFEAGRLEDAATVCRKGLAKSNFWNRDDLLTRLEEVEVARGNIAYAASIAIEKFLANPTADNYCSIQEVCTKAGYWNSIRPMLLRYLKTQSRDEIDTVERPSAREFSDTPPGWLFADNKVLISIAIRERRFQEAFALQEKTYVAGKGPYILQENQKIDDLVATELVDLMPEKAYALWEKCAIQMRGETGVTSYRILCIFLKKMHSVASKCNKMKNWYSHIAFLRNNYKNRIKFQEFLDNLEKELGILHT